MKELLIVMWLSGVLTKVNYSNSFIAYYEGHVGKRNFDILQSHGYVLDKKIHVGDVFYQFKRRENTARFTTQHHIDENELKRQDPQLLFFKQERLWFPERLPKIKSQDVDLTHKYLQKRAITIQDIKWPNQWHLNPNQRPSMGVFNVWNRGYTGKGITVAIVDDGIDVYHTDLMRNYNASLSYDIIYDDPDPSHVEKEDGHGTDCAGVVAAVKNRECVIGTAYEASLGAIRLLDPYNGFRDSDSARALVYKLASFDIYSNSWGYPDTGIGFEYSLNQMEKTALEHGVTNGRNGKGVIYTWAAGNGGMNYDDCNVDGYANSMYTIAVNALAPDSSAAWYAEQCSSLLVATYGGDDRQKRITTTGRDGICVDDFQGTSAACPVASGIIALVLQANPALTWRDIQHMIVEFSINRGLKNANFYTNGAGKNVSLSHGFGLMDAEAMVNAAPNWKTVPNRISCVRDTSTVYRTSSGGSNVTATDTIDGCQIKYLEHVLVTVDFQSKYRQYTSIYLVSPRGTDTRLLRERRLDNGTSAVTWTFMSVHTWRENPAGVWTVRLQSSNKLNVMTLKSWQLTVYGTITNPLHESPRDGEYGGYCDKRVTCMEPTSYCLSKYNICVRCKSDDGVQDDNCENGNTNTQQDNSRSVRIGVGVGIGLGGFLVLAVIAVIYYKRLNGRTSESAAGNADMHGQTNIAYQYDRHI